MGATRRYLICSSLAVLACCGPVHGESSAERRLRQRLAERVTVAWRQQELRTALTGLGELHATPIWIDRRADPNQLIDLTADNQPLRRIVERAAEACGLGCACEGGVVYVGPTRAADELAALLAGARAGLDEADSATRRRWLKPRTIRWPRLTQPRQLVEKLAGEMGVTIAGVEAIPLDLLRAEDGMRIAPLDWLTLTAHGFDLTPRLDVQQHELHIEPIKRPLAAIPEGRQSRPAANQAQRTSRPRSPSDKVYTLAIENQPVGPVLDQLARQLSLTVVWDASPENANLRRRRVSCRVREAPLKELLAAIVAPAGLVGELDGKVYTVRPAE